MLSHSSQGGLAQSPKSLHTEAEQEAAKYKWIVSEKRGYDVGPQALQEWYDEYWADHCRALRTKHLIGEQSCLEYAEGDFGRMQNAYRSGNKLFLELVQRFEDGWENLDFVRWMHDDKKTPPEIEDIIMMLEIININMTRLEPRWKRPQN